MVYLKTPKVRSLDNKPLLFWLKRELGTTYSLLSENIVRKLRFLHDKYQLPNEERIYQPYSDQVMELTSRLDSSEVVSTMQKLSVPLKELKETR